MAACILRYHECLTSKNTCLTIKLEVWIWWMSSCDFILRCNVLICVELCRVAWWSTRIQPLVTVWWTQMITCGELSRYQYFRMKRQYRIAYCENYLHDLKSFKFSWQMDYNWSGHALSCQWWQRMGTEDKARQGQWHVMYYYRSSVIVLCSCFSLKHLTPTVW